MKQSTVHWSERKRKVWQALEEHYKNKSTAISLRSLFENDSERAAKLTITAGALTIDLSKNLIDDSSLELLLTLAEASNLRQKLEDLFKGEFVNYTQARPALHSALRVPSSPSSPFNATQQRAHEQVSNALLQMTSFIDAVHSGRWTGHSGKPLTDIVNIGVGGSDLGPKMACHALKRYRCNTVTSTALVCHFVSNIDDSNLGETLENLSPETTLFIVASKSFDTLETMQNAINARIWFLKSGNTDDICKHFVTVSSNIEKAKSFGIDPANIFPMWDWVGGRYSLWSSIGLSIALSIGMKNFKDFLMGAHDIDHHIQTQPFAQNAPVLLGLLGIVYGNMLHTQSQAVIAYDDHLAMFPEYLQQLDMESNGKRVSIEGYPLDYSTGQILWGGTGTNSQHSFHQLLHQGTQLCSLDFLLPLKSDFNIGDQHRYLVANCLAQCQALMNGKSETQAVEELLASGKSSEEAKRLAPHITVPGNKPSTLICYEKMSPRVLGQLIALYEHKVYVQSVIWDINAFDQWGVELGKQLCNALEPYLRHQYAELPISVDASTGQIIDLYHAANRPNDCNQK